MAGPVDLPSVVRLYQTTVIEREFGLGISITTAPSNSIAGGSLSSEDLADRLGLQEIRIYEPSDQLLLAILRAIVAPDEQAARARRNDVAHLAARTDEFVEHCAFASIVVAEQSDPAAKVLAGMVTAAGTICVGVVAVGAAPVLVAAGVGVGTVLVVGALGKPALAIGNRLAKLIEGQ